MTNQDLRVQTRTERNYQKVVHWMNKLAVAMRQFARSEAGHFRVLLLGSNSIPREHPLWTIAYEFGAGLAERRFDVVTGHGYGLMEAFHEGFNSVDQQVARAYGVPLQLPGEDKMQAEFTLFPASDFPGRIGMMDILASSVVGFPGGFGVAFELAHFLQHVQFMSRHKHDAQGGTLKNHAASFGYVPSVMAYNWTLQGDIGYFNSLRLFLLDAERQGMCRAGEPSLFELMGDLEAIFLRLEQKRTQWRESLIAHGLSPKN